MKLINVKVLKAHPYGRENRKPGQMATVMQSHLQVLERLGFVTSDVPVVKKPIPVEPQEDQSKRRAVKRYKRRDLKAEEHEQASEIHSETAESD